MPLIDVPLCCCTVVQQGLFIVYCLFNLFAVFVLIKTQTLSQGLYLPTVFGSSPGCDFSQAPVSLVAPHRPQLRQQTERRTDVFAVGNVAC